MKNILIVGSILLIVLVFGSGFFLMQQMNSRQSVQMEQAEVETTLTLPSADAIDPTTGEVSEEQFAQNQAVSSQDDLTTLENELDATVILEEDFSDL